MTSLYRDHEPKRLIVVHTEEGEFIYLGTIKRISTRPFDRQEEFVNTLSDSSEREFLYLKTEDKEYKVDLEDKLNAAFLKLSSFDLKNIMRSIIIESWHEANIYNREAKKGWS